MLSKSQEAAAFHGIATNVGFPMQDRLQAALQALEWYEAEVDRLHRLHNAAIAWRDWRREWIGSQRDWSDDNVQPAVRELAHAVDAIEV